MLNNQFMFGLPLTLTCFSADVNIYNIAVEGLKEYFINNLNLKLSDLTIDFDVTIPELLITCEFYIKDFKSYFTL